MTWELSESMMQFYRAGSREHGNSFVLSDILNFSDQFDAQIKNIVKSIIPCQIGFDNLDLSSPCEGCNACCGPAPLYSSEIVVIINYLLKHRELIPEIISSMKRIEALYSIMADPISPFLMPFCPFLFDNKCMIYCVRPVSCRLFGYTKNPFFKHECRFFDKQQIKTIQRQEQGTIYKKIKDLFIFENAPKNGIYYINHPVFIRPALRLFENIVSLV